MILTLKRINSRDYDRLSLVVLAEQISSERTERSDLVLFAADERRLILIPLETVVHRPRGSTCLFVRREFRNGFFEILHYNNCHCYTLSSGSEVRTSISKSNHSMNTKCTVHSHSQQANLTPVSNQLQRNGGPPSEPTLPKWTLKANKSESTDTFEMQILHNQRPTLEAFTELENLVPNGVSGRASIVQMNSLLYDQENPPLGKSFVSDDLITHRSNHS